MGEEGGGEGGEGGGEEEGNFLQAHLVYDQNKSLGCHLIVATHLVEHGCPSEGHGDLAGEPCAVQPPPSSLVPVVVACHPPYNSVPILTPHSRERAKGNEEREGESLHISTVS